MKMEIKNTNQYLSNFGGRVINKSFNEVFPGGLTVDVRNLLITHFNKSNATTDKELLIMLEDLVNNNNSLLNEQKSLKKEMATLSVDRFIQSGMLDVKKRQQYITIATIDLEIAKEQIVKDYTRKIEMESLLKMSNDELYFSDKLELLKEVDFASFKVKHKQIFNVEYSGN